MNPLKTCYSILLFFFFFYESCISQNHTIADKRKLELYELYKKYKDNRYDYGTRDTIIIRFQNTLKNTLKDPKFKNLNFKDLDSIQGIIVKESPDQKFIAISWDLLDTGCDHIYNSIFIYRDKNINNMFILNHNYPKEKENIRFEYPYKIFNLDKNTYLVKNTRLTCQSGRYITFRLFKKEKNNITECEDCFNGKREFIYLANRIDSIIPEFNSKNKTIKYPILVPVIHEGEDTGFKKPSKSFKLLSLKNIK